MTGSAGTRTTRPRWGALVPDAAVSLVLMSRLVPLLSAPVTLYLVAVHAAPAEQGFYFIFLNVQAIAALLEIGVGTMVVQFASHESPNLSWGASGQLRGAPDAIARIGHVVNGAWRWYAAVAVALFALLAPLGLWLFRGAGSASGIRYGGPWLVVVTTLALYLPVAPLLCVIEGCGGLLRVQRMRLAQAVVTVVALWLLIPTVGPLWAVAWFGVLWLLVAVGWLVATHAALVRQSLAWLRDGRRTPALPAGGVSLTPTPAGAPEAIAGGTPIGSQASAQWRAAASWIAPFVAGQLLGPLVFWRHGPVSAGQVGMSLAVATAPLTLGTAWLQARLPSYASLLARGQRDELRRLARTASGQALLVCATAGAGVVLVMVMLGTYAPALAARALPPIVIAALALNSIAMTANQAMAGYLRAGRAEPLAAAMLAGSAVALLAAAFTAGRGGGPAALAYALAGVLVTTPLCAARFLARGEG